MIKYTCPECTAIAEFDEIGLYRSRCKICNAVVKNKELKIIEREVKE